MPELPEVEIMAANLRRWIGERRLLELEIRDPALVRKDECAEGLSPAAFAGQPFSGVERRGKHLIIAMGACRLLAHCRMTGQFVREAPEARVRARLHFEGGVDVLFRDTRRLGTFHLLDEAGAREHVNAAGLGDEPWPKRRDGTWWRERLASSRSGLKGALMDQARVAGLGNIAASEICWEARLLPERKPSSLETVEWATLAESAHGFLARVIKEEGGDEIHFVGEGGDPSNSPFRVYRQEGAACIRCGDVIERRVDSGRATFFCGGCQR